MALLVTHDSLLHSSPYQNVLVQKTRHFALRISALLQPNITGMFTYDGALCRDARARLELVSYDLLIGSKAHFSDMLSRSRFLCGVKKFYGRIKRTPGKSEVYFFAGCAGKFFFLNYHRQTFCRWRSNVACRKSIEWNYEGLWGQTSGNLNVTWWPFWTKNSWERNLMKLIGSTVSSLN